MLSRADSEPGSPAMLSVFLADGRLWAMQVDVICPNTLQLRQTKQAAEVSRQENEYTYGYIHGMEFYKQSERAAVTLSQKPCPRDFSVWSRV